MSASFAVFGEKPVYVVFFADLHHGLDKTFSGKVNGINSVIKKAGSLALEFLPHMKARLDNMNVQPRAIYSLGDVITASNGCCSNAAARLFSEAINVLHEHFPEPQKISILGNNEWKGGIGGYCAKGSLPNIGKNNPARKILTGPAFAKTQIPFHDPYSSVRLTAPKDQGMKKMAKKKGGAEIVALNISCYCQTKTQGLNIVHEAELDHIKRALSKHQDKKTGVIITTHIPIQGHDRHKDNVQYSNDAHQILAKHQAKCGNILSVISGHVHQDHFHVKDDVPYISLGAPTVFVKENVDHNATDINQLSLNDLPLTFAIASLYPKSRAMEWNVYQGIEAIPTTQIGITL